MATRRAEIHPKTKARRPAHDPLLAIHRIRKVELTDARCRQAGDFDFETLYQDGFGIIREKPQRIEVEFRGWAAKYVSERRWSKDQKIRSCSGDRVRLSLTVASVEEAIAWLLSFGECFKILRPGRIKSLVLATARKIIANHQSGRGRLPR